MKEKLTVSCEGKPCYDIVLTLHRSGKLFPLPLHR